jgi:hypothetical protein
MMVRITRPLRQQKQSFKGLDLAWLTDSRYTAYRSIARLLRGVGGHSTLTTTYQRTSA